MQDLPTSYYAIELVDVCTHYLESKEILSQCLCKCINHYIIVFGLDNGKVDQESYDSCDEKS